MNIPRTHLLAPLPSASRRLVLGSLLVLGVLASSWAQQAPVATVSPPIVFLHGNGDTAAQWQTQIWRFESNGWPRDRLFALRQPYPWARSNDLVEQAGRTSGAEHMAFLRREVERIRKATGEQKVVLVGNSRGGNAIRNYIVNGGGEGAVSHAILGGTPNHGIWAIPGFAVESEFSGLGAFLKQLNQAKNATGDEVAGPVRWMTLRSDSNDRYAQPDGQWLGRPGQPTHVGYDSPELKGALNVVLPKADHRETSYSAASFAQTWLFITGKAPATTDIAIEASVRVQGVVTGQGLASGIPPSGDLADNLPVSGARVEIYGVDASNGVRVGAALLDQVVQDDGRWGPVEVPPGAPVELVVSAPGYATTHYYRSGFPRSTDVGDLRVVRRATADSFAPSVVILWRPRGYLDPSRKVLLDGAPPPNVPPGAGIAWSKIKPEGDMRAVHAEFEGERLVGRNWPAKDGHVVYLEITQ